MREHDRVDVPHRRSEAFGLLEVAADEVDAGQDPLRAGDVPDQRPDGEAVPLRGRDDTAADAAGRADDEHAGGWLVHVMLLMAGRDGGRPTLGDRNGRAPDDQDGDHDEREREQDRAGGEGGPDLVGQQIAARRGRRSRRRRRR